MKLANTGEPVPQTPPLSLQLYSVREALGQDFLGTMKRVADIGYTLVEPYDFVAQADQLAKGFAEYGLSAPSAHLRFLDADLNETFSTAARIGIPTVIDPFVDPSKWTSRDDINKTADALNAAVATAAEHGIRIGYHNHQFELENVIDGVTGLEILADALDPAVILELDTYWAAVGGQDVVALLGRLGDRVHFIHIKDGPIVADPLTQVAVGSGKMPVWDVIAAAKNVEVGVVELDAFAGDMFDAVTDSLAYLTGTKASA
jgi:sugar phosphate isomerase/epimerase